MAKKYDAKKIAVCSLLSALGVAILWLGRVIPVMDMSMAVIASVFAVVAVIEYGKSAPWLVYAVTSVLSLILMSDNSAVYLYVFFLGFYPIIKEKLEGLKKGLCWLLKEIIFNAGLALLLIGEKLLLTADTTEPWYFYLAFIILAEIAFPLYDVALTRLITLYLRKIRPKLRLK